MPQRPLFLLLCLIGAVTLCCAEPATMAVMVKGPKAEPVPDAVISLVPLDGAAFPPAKGQVEIDQHNQEFSAYVTAVQAGTTIVFPNKDTVQHHVYSLSKAKKFELPLYNPGQAEAFVFDTPGVVTLGCNIHDWMLAYIVIVPSPYFEKTNALGLATVTAPAGRYRLEVWHPRLKSPVTQEITLAAGETAKREFPLTLSPDRRIRRAQGSKTGGY